MASSPATRRCGNCGARINAHSRNTCAFCEAELPLSASPTLSKAQRFELLRRHPSCPRLLSRKPSTAGLMRVNGFFFVTLIAAVVISGVIGLSGFANGDAGAYFCLAVALAASTTLAWMLRRAAQHARKGLRAVPAVVLRTQERSVVNAGGAAVLAVIDPAIWATLTFVNAVRDTSPRATIELYDGKRLDLELVEDVERTLEPGDLGIAYVAAGYLVDFARVEG